MENKVTELKVENTNLEEQRYAIMEIFDSIQGEGSMMGMPVTFIRMKGCNLACPWCDTKESWKKEEPNMTIQEIIAKCNRTQVVITGGEPCAQNIAPLVEALHRVDKFVAIETNGTLPTPENIDWVVCSPKPPYYKIHENCWFNELKYVVDDNFSLDCVPEDMKQVCGPVWLQPCDYGKGQEARTEASIQKCVQFAMDTTFLRVGIQLHKIFDLK